MIHTQLTLWPCMVLLALSPFPTSQSSSTDDPSNARAVEAVLLASPDPKKVKNAVLSSRVAADMAASLGNDMVTVEKVVDELIANQKAGGQTSVWNSHKSADAATGSLLNLLDFEQRRIVRAQTHLQQLRVQLRIPGALENTVRAAELPVTNYGAAATETAALRAAKWIVNASNTDRGDTATLAAMQLQLETAVRMNVPTDEGDLDTINKLLVGTGGRKSRPVANTDTPLTSSKVGRALMLQALQVDGLAGARPMDRAAYLFGALVRCHGFSDGNGRTARFAYALTLLQADPVVFLAPNSVCESELSGLQ